MASSSLGYRIAYWLTVGMLVAALYAGIVHDRWEGMYLVAIFLFRLFRFWHRSDAEDFQEWQGTGSLRRRYRSRSPTLQRPPTDRP